MKKVININFQGRVIPIEESAFEILKQYIDSLRRYFANEEGRDEIINDIEGRIGELFAERLKSGSTCITDEDVNHVIAGMGRPEDFEAQEGEVPPSQGPQPSAAASSNQSYQKQTGRGTLYRNADDKILGGVCSGLANYLGIDPIVMRIIFVLLFGALFWVYILLWIIVPSKSIESNITKRLYRSSDEKVIAGVAGGVAAYFNIAPWIPRLIFALPFLLSLISGGFDSWWWNWDFGFVPRIVSGSFGWAMFVSYIILWIAVPVASTATEKLEMRGEKVDLNSIANTVKEDLEQFRVKAEKVGAEVKTSAQRFGQEASAQFKTYSSRTGRSGFMHAIGVIFKAFFIFIFAIVALSLFGVFIGLLFGGIAFAPLQGFILEGTFQYILAWSTLTLVLLLPMVALITWGIRRIMGVRSKRHSVGYAFLSLWIIGLISAGTLFFLVARNFKRNIMLDEEQITIVQPQSKLYVDVERKDWKQFDHQFFGFDVDDDFPWYTKGDDSLLINTVRISMVKSNDSAYHVYRIRGSRGRTTETARETAEKITFEPAQTDSVLTFPRGFFISKEEKFRNQRVWIVVEIPVGKRVEFSERISDWDWMEMNNRRSEDYGDWDTIGNIYQPVPGREYIMHEDGKPRAGGRTIVDL
jgi:phage shock protein PspC (stress-responsive transcriptional regulator)